MRRARARWSWWIPPFAFAASLVAVPVAAVAVTGCGNSNGHTICVTVPSGALTGAVQVTVTNDPNDGTVIATWIPSGKPGIFLIQKTAPSPDYSFVWPTQKYLDASGVLRVQHGSTASEPVDVAVSLSNGNTTDFQRSPDDWATFLPGPWTGSRDPVVAAVGDGPDGAPTSVALAQSIAAGRPDLFLFLGDIYEKGTFTENLSHYGQNSMDGGSGTVWGQMGTITQPTIGNHEAAANVVDWRDYWHQRPLYTSFRFGNVLFLDLASDVASMAAGSAQYNYVKGILTSATDPPPPCIVAFFHRPALSKDTINTSRLAMWELLTNNGGDLVLNGHIHTMIQYRPLNAQLQLPSPGEPTMVQLVNGAGGHRLSGAFTSDPRVEWSVGRTPGAIYLTLEGAAGGGTPSRLSWQFRATDGRVLHTGTRDCGPPSSPAPTITGFSPTSGAVGTSVTIDGSGFTGATDVRFNGTSGSFSVESDTRITATVPAGATTGPISVVTPGGTATSASPFTVTAGDVLTFSPQADAYVRADRPDANFGSATSLQVDNSPVTHSLIRFTVSGVGSRTVSSVKLRLYCVNASGVGGSFYPLVDPGSWQEGTVTWNTKPAADTTPITSLGSVAADTWYEVDLTSLVVGDGTYGLLITSTSSNGADYTSREGTAGFGPQLVVTLAG